MNKIATISITIILVSALLITLILIFFFHFKKHKNSLTNSFLADKKNTLNFYKNKLKN